MALVETLWSIDIVRAVLKALIVNVFAFLNVLWLIYMERKVCAFIQNRLGPNRVGPWGLLQTLADGIKLVQKEDIIPRGVDQWLWWMAPAITFASGMMVWVIIPFGPQGPATDLNIGIIYLAAAMSYDVIGVFMSGWGSNNKYSLLGAMRGAAQMISYEVTLILSIIGVVMMTGTFSIHEIVNLQAQRGSWFIWPQFIGFTVFVVASLAELQRAPFDLTEAESELVSGYHTEYAGIRWAMFAFSEYVHLLAWSAIAAALFLGGWHGPTPADLLRLPLGIGDAISGIGWLKSMLEATNTGFMFYVWPFFWFMFKTYLFVFVAMWIRWTLPRVRIDQLMDLGWKFLLPVALFNIFLTGVLKYAATVLPADTTTVSLLFTQIDMLGWWR